MDGPARRQDGGAVSQDCGLKGDFKNDSISGRALAGASIVCGPVSVAGSVQYDARERIRSVASTREVVTAYFYPVAIGEE